jgi:hypothetical protein
MPTVKLQPGEDLGTAGGLCALLGSLRADLQKLKRRVDTSRMDGSPADLGYRPRQMRALGEILGRGRSEIARKIAGLGGAGNPGDESTANPGRAREEFDLAGFMVEYRGCCRRLCAALNEARRVSDDATSALLSDLALRLERQLWLMDRRPKNDEIEYGRVVSLFLAC